MNGFVCFLSSRGAYNVMTVSSGPSPDGFFGEKSDISYPFPCVLISVLGSSSQSAEVIQFYHYILFFTPHFLEMFYYLHTKKVTHFLYIIFFIFYLSSNAICFSFLDEFLFPLFGSYLSLFSASLKNIINSRKQDNV